MTAVLYGRFQSDTATSTVFAVNLTYIFFFVLKWKGKKKKEEKKKRKEKKERKIKISDEKDDAIAKKDARN